MANVQQSGLSNSGTVTAYERDLVAWARDNAVLLREGRLDEIDAAHIAEELDDLGKSERRALSMVSAISRCGRCSGDWARIPFNGCGASCVQKSPWRSTSGPSSPGMGSGLRTSAVISRR